MPSLLSSGGITGFVLKRLLIGVMVLVVVSVIVFAATRPCRVTRPKRSWDDQPLRRLLPRSGVNSI